MSRMARILGALLVISLAVPALGQVTDEDIERARAEVRRISAESQELGDAVQAAWARQAQLDHEIAELTASIEYSQIRLADARDRLEEVAVELYMGSASAISLSALFANGSEYGPGLEYLRQVSGVDEELINSLTIFRRELDRQTQRLSEASAEQELLAAELEEMAEHLLADLSAAQQNLDRLVAQQQREEEERRRQEEERRRQEEERRRQEAEAAQQTTTTTIAAAEQTTTTTSTATTTVASDDNNNTTTTTEPPAPPPSSSGGTCPVAGAASFTDTWGAPRSGGRTHQGVDMIAARGTPIVAIFAGTITRISSGVLSGKSVWLLADDGDRYFYAHLDGYGDISAGQRVAEGYVIGFNGSTGNAPDWLPHLHFEWHPGGGPAANPYPLVRSIC